MGRKSKLYQEKKSKMAVIQAADDLLIETLRVIARDQHTHSRKETEGKAMFLSTKDQLRKERQKNQALAAQLSKARSDLDYVTMMTGVDIPELEEEEQYETKREI